MSINKYKQSVNAVIYNIWIPTACSERQSSEYWGTSVHLFWVALSRSTNCTITYFQLLHFYITYLKDQHHKVFLSCSILGSSTCCSNMEKQTWPSFLSLYVQWTRLSTATLTYLRFNIKWCIQWYIIEWHQGRICMEKLYWPVD